MDNRTFLSGDAVHAHSPTTCADMKVSMQDSFNLARKPDRVDKALLGRSSAATEPFHGHGWLC